jgi:hypothetical protein
MLLIEWLCSWLHPFHPLHLSISAHKISKFGCVAVMHARKIEILCVLCPNLLVRAFPLLLRFRPSSFSILPLTHYGRRNTATVIPTRASHRQDLTSRSPLPFGFQSTHCLLGRHPRSLSWGHQCAQWHCCRYSSTRRCISFVSEYLSTV